MQNYVKRVVKGSHDLLVKFLDTSISRKRFELETSNLAWRLIARGTIEKCKISSKRSIRDHVAFF